MKVHVPKIRMSALKSQIKTRKNRVLQRIDNLKSRRPHRSFQRTRRRDLPKRAPLPGNINFTVAVIAFMNQNWRTYAVFGLVYFIAYFLFAGLASQENYQLLSTSVRQFGPEIAGGEFGRLSEVSTIFGVTVIGALSAGQTEIQQMYVVFLVLISWLVTVWFARQRFNGLRVRARDAFYNAGAPLVPTIMVSFLLLLQLVPAAIGVVGFSVLQGLGMLEIGVVSMAMAIVAGLLCLLSAYWLTSTVIALIAITVPGTYPMTAIKIAGDITVGRRLQVLVRLFWLGLSVLALWIVVLIPIILVESFISFGNVPVIPLLVQLLSVVSLLFTSTYIYILYRGMINESITTK